MGHCVSKKQNNKNDGFNWKQLYLLQKMFEDLSLRSKDNLITKDTFKSFFNLNGLWGEEIFRKFDEKSKGQLCFDSFRKGLDVLVKGSHQKQIYYLFQFYDVSKQNGIRYDELLKMLYSYSKQQLKNLVSDDNFLGTMKQEERMYIMGNKQDLDPLREVIEESSSSEQDDQQNKVPLKVGGLRRVSDTSNFKYSRKTSSSKCLRDITQSNNVNAQKIGNQLIDKNKKHKQKYNSTCKGTKIKRRGTMICPQIKKTQIKTIPTIALLAKKYAAYLFNQFKLDKDKDSLTFQQFQKLVFKHEKLFDSYFGGFHQYIWKVQQNASPDFIKLTSWVQGPVTVYDVKKNSSSRRYIKFYRTTLFVLRNSQESLPQLIINLEGLIVSKYDNGKQFGFLIQHRDGVYPQRAYLFSSASIQQEWFVHLQSYTRNRINEEYRMMQRIGSGNYSIVYKGVKKNNGLDVAIKVIQKFKFSLAQKQVIKQECDILELTHHPSIVNFIEKIETKTHLFIIAELMADGDLLDYVKKNKYLTEYQAASIMFQLLSALEYLDTLTIIHRDIKCQNIMVKYNKEKNIVDKVKIIDFGFAVYKDVLEKLPSKERFVGTPNYVAPQILKNEQFDAKVDVFSVGVIMYYMLCGQLPFDSLFMQQISRTTVQCDYSLQGIIWDDVSADAKDLIKKILCQEPKRLTVHQALKHPWIKNKQDLKQRGKRNRYTRYI